MAHLGKSGQELPDYGKLDKSDKPSGPAREYLWQRLQLAGRVLGWKQEQIDSWEPYVTKLAGMGAARKKHTW